MSTLIDVTFDSIESLDYSARMNIVSHLEMLKRIVREDASYRRLRDFMDIEPIHVQTVRNRFNVLCLERTDPKYEHTFDIAFFVYILALFDQTNDTWIECGKMVCTPRLWWTKYLINELMNPKMF